MRKALLCIGLVALCGCSDPEKESLKKTTLPTYDAKTGKLKEVTFDSNKNGTIDTWTEMDGSRVILTRMDLNEDGRIDRWEHFGDDGKLLKVGFSRADNGKADAWAYAGADGRTERIEISSHYDEKRIDRWEHYDTSGLARAEEDADGDGVVDKWETYAGGALKTVAFDDSRDGRPDRRFTYENGRLVRIESEPDGAGGFRRSRVPEK
jgi:hypothetical protein